MLASEITERMNGPMKTPDSAEEGLENGGEEKPCREKGDMGRK